jgi:hypothetical protein
MISRTMVGIGCAVWLSVASAAKCDPPASGGELASQTSPAISTNRVKQHVEYLASPELEGRGTAKGKQLASKYILERFGRLGLKPAFDDGLFEQQVPGQKNENGQSDVIGKNLAAWLPGRDPELRNEIVILNCHYDHLGVDRQTGAVFAGADDNATGVAMMLEVACELSASKTPPRRSVAFVAFDLEERLLWGSRWFAAHPPWPIEQIKLCITADMIGRSLGDLPLPMVFVLGTEHAPELRKLLDGVATPDGLEVARMGVDLIGTRSDYGPFRDRKVPFLFFSTGEHPDYHTARDTAERVDHDKVARVSNLILGLTRIAADADSTPAWVDRPEHELDEVRALHRITELLLKADGAKQLTPVQQFFVSNVRTRTSQILKAGEMKSDDRAWLIRSSQLLLLTVF